MFEWDEYFTIDMVATKESVWEFLVTPNEWHVWDTDIKSVKFHEPIDKNNLEDKGGRLFMANGREFDFVVKGLKTNSYFQYITTHPGATAHWYWKIEPSSSNVESVAFTMGVRWEGYAALLYKTLLRSTVVVALETCSKNLKVLAEK
ncbi:hypothetical protein HDV02_006366 [Globomyces sp. JEL0801]|nr:hypothetical protein HDV02_006366 [Globomyces sp. JEL0801]